MRATQSKSVRECRRGWKGVMRGSKRGILLCITTDVYKLNYFFNKENHLEYWV